MMKLTVISYGLYAEETDCGGCRFEWLSGFSAQFHLREGVAYINTTLPKHPIIATGLS